MKLNLTITILLVLSACTFTRKIKDGKTAFERKQYAVAAPFLEKEFKSAKSRKEKGAVAYMLGMTYQKMNKDEKSVQWFEAAYDNNYGVEALRAYANALKRIGKYDEAAQAFKNLGIEIGSPYAVRKDITSCKIAKGWRNEKQNAYSIKSVDFNTAAAEYAPFPYGDDLVFTSDRASATGEEKYNWTRRKFSDLFIAKNASKDVQLFDNHINTTFNEGTASFNHDLSEVYFTRCFSETGGDMFCAIMMSEKDGDGWSVPHVLDFVEDGVNYGHPAISADGSMLYFSSDYMDGWGGFDIYYCERTQKGWGYPHLLSRAVNTEGNEQYPFLDGDTLYFASDGHTGMGGLDVFKTYKMKNGDWAPVQNLKYPINSESDDFGFVVKNNRKSGEILQTGYFTSTRPGGKGNEDIYEFEKRKIKPLPVDTTENIEYSITLDVFVVGKIYADPEDPMSKVLGKKIITGAQLEVIDDDKQHKTYVVDSTGSVHFDVQENSDYSFRASKDGYLSNEMEFSTTGIGKDPAHPHQHFELEILLEKIFKNKEIVLENIYYDFDKWDIRDDAKPTLNKLVKTLLLNPGIDIQIASHTDCRGKEAYNLELSQKRAQSVVEYLINHGIDAGRLSAKGYGESALLVNCICSQCSEEAHQQNRRTTFKIIEN